MDVVLPALDEAAALPELLGRFPYGFRAVVVDNGSRDGTAEVAAALGAVVVSEPQRGFGAACWAGLAAVETEIVCFMDADGSFDPQELERVVAPLLSSAADLVLGARQADRGAWPLHARVANRALAWELRRRSGTPLRDLGPMRAARVQPLRALGMVDRRSGWPLEMVLRAQRAGWRICEVPVSYHPRVGRSKVTGTVRGTARAVGDMARILRTLPPGGLAP
ncbi:MAG: glycosyltransferase family 2 protein [Acidimicrobiales bacterium]